MEAFEVDLIESLRECEGCDRVNVFVAPHAPYSCSLANLKRGAELSRQYNLPVHIHLSETTDEVNMVRQTYDMTPTEFIDSLGYFDQPTIAAHCVRLTEGDVRILRDKGVTAVHNPQSNMKLSSGISPVWHLLRSGVNVALGTDGTCSNNDLDMWDEMRTAALLQKVSGTDPTVLPAYEALRMATVYGAKALGKEGELGVIAEGALADIILIDTSRPHLHPMNDIASALVYCGKASDVSTVMIDGRIVVQDGVIVGVNLPELYSEIDACISSIKQRV
jgi:5-methylthioadenosine/S-adenosylhomocysteine deaminase